MPAVFIALDEVHVLTRHWTGYYTELEGALTFKWTLGEVAGNAKMHFNHFIKPQEQDIIARSVSHRSIVLCSSSLLSSLFLSSETPCMCIKCPVKVLCFPIQKVVGECLSQLDLS
jgi:hypothetical protein